MLNGIKWYSTDYEQKKKNLKVQSEQWYAQL